MAAERGAFLHRALAFLPEQKGRKNQTKIIFMLLRIMFIMPFELFEHIIYIRVFSGHVNHSPNVRFVEFVPRVENRLFSPLVSLFLLSIRQFSSSNSPHHYVHHSSVDVWSGEHFPHASHPVLCDVPQRNFPTRPKDWKCGLATTVNPSTLFPTDQAEHSCWAAFSYRWRSA